MMMDPVQTPSKLGLKKWTPRCCSQGFRFWSIIIHSLWITVVGVILFRLATANTQQVLVVEIFAISGAIIATAPWVLQLLVSATVIILFNAGLCDLTWLVAPSLHKGGSCSNNRRHRSGAVAQEVVDSSDDEKDVMYRVGDDMEQGFVLDHGKNCTNNGFSISDSASARYYESALQLQSTRIS